MYSPRHKLDTPIDYEFPHQPYAIQQLGMEAVYSVLEEKGIGIFESPTGTGKSLTLTCAALRWLEDHEALVRQDLRRRIEDVAAEVARLDANAAHASDWIKAQFAVSEQRDEWHQLRQLHEKLLAHELQLQLLKERKAQQRKDRSRRPRQAQDYVSEKDEDDVDLVEVHDGEQMDRDMEKTEETEERYRDVQIFFCSRTHSQLAQVVREVKRSAYGRRIRCVSLASRQQLCIHPQLRRLSSSALINERCLDMLRADKSSNSVRSSPAPLKRSKGKSCCCPHRASSSLQQLGDTALVDILDIEELVAEGEALSACPYYAIRAATPSAQLVMLPYQLLLHRRTRQQAGIDLRGAVIIIDEAHNLLDTIAQLHSCELTLQQLLLALQQIEAYKKRYAKRFSPANMLRINQLLFVVKRLAKLLQPTTTRVADARVLRTYELSAEGEFFNIDLFALLEFCERTRFAQKLQGFARQQLTQSRPSQNDVPLAKTAATVDLLRLLQMEYQTQAKKKGQRKPIAIIADNEMASKKSTEFNGTSPIRPLLAFIEALTECADDGRVLLNIDAKRLTSRTLFKYILLNPGAHFADIVHEARSIIVAGGTMQPTAELTSQLFHSAPERVRLHFYDHVVPADAVLPFAVTCGPSGRQLCFNYTQRGSDAMLAELAMTLQNLCSVIPAGLVCFFSSYDYLDTVYAFLQRHDILARIASKKRIFREPRSSGQSVEQLLQEYSAAIDTASTVPQRGALLLSVVGGKLSEGLNFADGLGRGVVVVGLPYPSRNSPELQERMKYLDATLGTGSGNEYYENLCMKAVNQCIGRSVRHIRDYACVYLLDERYASERIQQKLPQWIGRSLQTATTFGALQAATAKFFKQKAQSSG